MNKITLNKIYDCRNFGQLDDGYPCTVGVDCTDEKGSEYSGWYYLSDDWKEYKFSDGTLLGEIGGVGRYYFWQTKLPNGKKCERKVSSKIQDEIISLINKNKDTVRDYSKIWNEVK